MRRLSLFRQTDEVDVKGFRGETNVPGFVYLLHFDKPLCHAKHYIGWTSDLTARIKAHRSGNGGKLMAAVVAAGIGFCVARVWSNKTHEFEKYLKTRKESERFCPICSENILGELSSQDAVACEKADDVLSCELVGNGESALCLDNTESANM